MRLFAVRYPLSAQKWEHPEEPEFGVQHVRGSVVTRRARATNTEQHDWEDSFVEVQNVFQKQECDPINVVRRQHPVLQVFVESMETKLFSHLTGTYLRDPKYDCFNSLLACGAPLRRLWLFNRVCAAREKLSLHVLQDARVAESLYLSSRVVQTLCSWRIYVHCTLYVRDDMSKSTLAVDSRPYIPPTYWARTEWV